MAKMYVDPGKVTFYDAFGGKQGEIEKVYMDTFDRGGLSYCSCDTADMRDYATFAVQNCDMVDDRLLKKIKGEIGTFDASTATVELMTSAEEFKESIKRLQEQIDELKAAPKSADKLRSALKTLRYKHEIE